MINSGREWDWMDKKTKMMKKYIVIERNRKWDSFDFINDFSEKNKFALPVFEFFL